MGTSQVYSGFASKYMCASRPSLEHPWQTLSLKSDLYQDSPSLAPALPLAISLVLSLSLPFSLSRSLSLSLSPCLSLSLSLSRE